MKTKLTLTILGILNLLGATSLILSAIFLPVNELKIVISDNPDVLRMGTLMSYLAGVLFLIIGLILLMSRNCSLVTAKNLLLAYILGELAHVYVLFGIFRNDSLMNFPIEDIIWEIPVLGLAIFGYFKAKE